MVAEVAKSRSPRNEMVEDENVDDPVLGQRTAQPVDSDEQVAGDPDPQRARGGVVHQAHVLDVELAQPLSGVSRRGADGVEASAAWLVVRLHGRPLGLLRTELPEAGLTPAALREVLCRGYADAVRQGEQGIDEAGFRAGHLRFLATAPACSVVICTRENPRGLRAALASLVHQDHPTYRVFVVDNAAVTSRTRRVVAEFTDRLDLHYIWEPTPGLSRARNTALAADLLGDIVAWLDDDEIADSIWLSELVRGFARPEVVAASGVVVPAELATLAQVQFESFGGHSKGRGFIPAEFSPTTAAQQDPLFPLPPFGVGANMAHRIETLRTLGGFDKCLGAGTATHGGEDTKVFTQLLRGGGTTLYRPSAMTRHTHRPQTEGLRQQMFGYGCGLTAFYTAMIIDEPAVLLSLVRLAPGALREVFTSSGKRTSEMTGYFPEEILRANRQGMLRGPARYLSCRRAQRREASVLGGTR